MRVVALLLLLLIACISVAYAAGDAQFTVLNSQKKGRVDPDHWYWGTVASMVRGLIQLQCLVPATVKPSSPLRSTIPSELLCGVRHHVPSTVSSDLSAHRRGVGSRPRGR